MTRWGELDGRYDDDDDDDDRCFCGGALIADEDRPGGLICLLCQDTY